MLDALEIGQGGDRPAVARAQVADKGVGAGAAVDEPVQDAASPEEQVVAAAELDIAGDRAGGLERERVGAGAGGADERTLEISCDDDRGIAGAAVDDVTDRRRALFERCAVQARSRKEDRPVAAVDRASGAVGDREDLVRGAQLLDRRAIARGALGTVADRAGIVQRAAAHEDGAIAGLAGVAAHRDPAGDGYVEQPGIAAVGIVRRVPAGCDVAADLHGIDPARLGVEGDAAID